MLALIFICFIPPLFVLLLCVLGLFIPVGYVCHFFAWFAGLATILFTAGALYNFDITSIEDWKGLAFSFLIPGSITLLLVLLGNWLGEHHIFEMFQLIKNLFS